MSLEWPSRGRVMASPWLHHPSLRHHSPRTEKRGISGGMKGPPRANKPGMYAEGGGFDWQVTGTGAKSWIYRYMLRGKEREMGLGSLSAVGLADARTKATECRSLRQAGVDPIEARKSVRDQARLDATKALTFKDAAVAYIGAHRAGWRNPKHIWQGGATLVASI